MSIIKANAWQRTNGTVVGTILQTVSMTTFTAASSTSQTFTDTGLTATITPFSTSNKIIIMANFGDTSNQNQGGPAGVKLILLKNGTAISGGAGQPGGNFANQWNYAGAANEHSITSGSQMYVDSPASTSALTYKFQFASQTTGRTAELMRDNTAGTLILMEVQA